MLFGVGCGPVNPPFYLDAISGRGFSLLLAPKRFGE